MNRVGGGAEKKEHTYEQRPRKAFGALFTSFGETLFRRGTFTLQKCAQQQQNDNNNKTTTDDDDDATWK